MERNKIGKALLGGLLTALGFGCTDGGVIAMYGTPHATYKVKGTVTDSERRPIKDILVKVGHDSEYITDSARTDTDGRVEFTLKETLYDNNTRVIFKDTDGELNGGSFGSRTITVAPEQVESGSGAWDNGTFEIRFEESLEPAEH